MTPTPPLLDIRGLSIRLPAGADRALAVKEASLSVAAGETLCIVGESGSGKSMIANAVMGLLPQPLVAPVAGTIAFQGQDLLALREPQWRALRGNRIGMIFQDPMSALNPVMRIGEQLEEALDAHLQLTPADKRARILAALRDVRLPDPEGIAASYPGRLSGGQRQRVMIACALMLEPALLIADEPTTALDVTIQAQILDLIRRLQQELGTGVVMITHDLGVVAESCHRVVVMYAGRKVEEANVADLFDRPLHPYTRALMASMPSMNTGSSRLTEIPGLVPSPQQPQRGCAFAPRCAQAQARCHTEMPRLSAQGADHFVACFAVETRQSDGVAPVDSTPETLA